MPTGSDLLAVARTQAGDPYVWAAEANPQNADPDAFDCSELVQWAAGRLGISFVDGSVNQHNACEAAGLGVTTARALGTPGALLFRMDTNPHHVAICIGDGHTVFEARGKAYKVGAYSAEHRHWTGGGLIPGIDYGTPHPSTAKPAPEGPVTAMAAAGAAAYWLAGRDGGVFCFGGAPFVGSAANLRLNGPIVGIAATPAAPDATPGGYWLAGADGGVFAFGDAGFFGSAGGVHLNSPVTGIVASPSSRGYWLVAADGGVFAFGDAPFRGSLGG